MDNFDKFGAETPSENDPVEMEELSHSDKMAGMYTSPSETFQKISLFPPRTMDWLLPIIILLFVVVASQLIILSNDEVYYNTKQSTLAKTEERLSKSVEEGKITREQAEERYEMFEKQYEMSRSTFGKIMIFVSVFIVGFIFFFLVVALHYLLVKFALKGNGNFSSALVANGLPAYISIIQVILGLILAFVFGRAFADTSLASFFDADKTTIAGFLLAKIDPLTIWIYTVASIGLAKMFKSPSTGKYFAVVFGVWIIGTFLWFLLGQLFPILQGGM
jgi:uncharacterized membrane protein (DUF106 family)